MRDIDEDSYDLIAIGIELSQLRYNFLKEVVEAFLYNLPDDHMFLFKDVEEIVETERSAFETIFHADYKDFSGRLDNLSNGVHFGIENLLFYLDKIRPDDVIDKSLLRKEAENILFNVNDIIKAIESNKSNLQQFESSSSVEVFQREYNKFIQSIQSLSGEYATLYDSIWDKVESQHSKYYRGTSYRRIPNFKQKNTDVFNQYNKIVDTIAIQPLRDKFKEMIKDFHVATEKVIEDVDSGRGLAYDVDALNRSFYEREKSLINETMQTADVIKNVYENIVSNINEAITVLGGGKGENAKRAISILDSAIHNLEVDSSYLIEGFRSFNKRIYRMVNSAVVFLELVNKAKEQPLQQSLMNQAIEELQQTTLIIGQRMTKILNFEKEEYRSVWLK